MNGGGWGANKWSSVCPERMRSFKWLPFHSVDQMHIFRKEKTVDMISVTPVFSVDVLGCIKMSFRSTLNTIFYKSE